jgi:hypothetical protein
MISISSVGMIPHEAVNTSSAFTANPSSVISIAQPIAVVKAKVVIVPSAKNGE